jgi:hypothetical protein
MNEVEAPEVSNVAGKTKCSSQTTLGHMSHMKTRPPLTQM